MEHKIKVPAEPHVSVDDPASLNSDVAVDSATLSRLLAEVRNEDAFEPNAYNRMHNRHNR